MHNPQVYSLLIIAQCIFGINFIASKLILSQFSPTLWSAIRFSISGLVLLIVGLIKYKKSFPKITINYVSHIFIYSVLGITLCQITFLQGLKLTTAINASILTSLIPIFTLIFAVMMGKEKLTFYSGLGFILSLIGCIIIRKFENFSFNNETFLGDFFVLLSAISTALFFASAQNFMKKNNHFWASMFMFFSGAIQLIVINYFVHNNYYPTNYNFSLIACMFHAIFLSTLLTYFLNNWALAKISGGKVSLFIYLQPLITTIFSIAILDEKITWRLVCASLLIMIGFVTALKK